MQRLDFVGLLGGARFRAPAPDVPIYAAGGQTRVLNAVTGETVALSLSQGAVAQVLGATTHGSRVAVTVRPSVSLTLTSTLLVEPEARGAVASP